MMAGYQNRRAGQGMFVAEVGGRGNKLQLERKEQSGNFWEDLKGHWNIMVMPLVIYFRL